MASEREKDKSEKDSSGNYVSVEDGYMGYRTFSPQSESEALELLKNQADDLLPIAGGTNVLVDIRKGKVNPRALVDLSRIKGWKEIKYSDGVLEIGSLVTHSELEANPLIKGPFAALAMAASMVGSPQIRNRGTLGGNLQSASPAADCVTPLLVFDATLTLVSATGWREVYVADFFLGVGKTILRPNELISKITITTNSSQKSIFIKAGQRQALAISIVNLAVCLEFDEDNRCKKAKVAFGSVASTPIRAKRLELFLEGRMIDSDTIKGSSMYVEQDITPITDLRASATNRRLLAKMMIKDALLNLMKSKEEHKWPRPQ